jgi:hypothetical protein
MAGVENKPQLFGMPFCKIFNRSVDLAYCDEFIFILFGCGLQALSEVR